MANVVCLLFGAGQILGSEILELKKWPAVTQNNENALNQSNELKHAKALKLSGPAE